MDIELSKLIDAMSCGQEVFLTRHGKRVAQMLEVPTQKPGIPSVGEAG